MTWQLELIRLKGIFQPLLWRIPFALLILVAGVLIAFLVRHVLEYVRVWSIRHSRTPFGSLAGSFVYPSLASITILIATVSLTLLALGVGGTVIGFVVSLSVALGLVADTFAGLRIFLLHPFGVGDIIELKEAGSAGAVEQISLLGTVLITPERSRVYVPNRQFFEHPVVNHSESNTRKLALFEFVLEPPPAMEDREELFQQIVQDFHPEQSEITGEVFLTRIDAATVTVKVKLELSPWLKDKTASAFLQHAEAECKRHQIKIHSLALIKP